MKHQDRSRIEALIGQEDAVLRECADLIKRRVPLKQWPRDTMVSFLLAIQLKGETREAYKAYRTARHLHLDRTRLPLPPDNVDAIHRRCAERIRSDLPRLVRLGQGKFLQDFA